MKASLPTLNSAINSLKEKRTRELAFTTQKTNDIDGNRARISILVEPTYFDRLNEENLSIAVAKAFPGVRYLPNSLHVLSDKDKRIKGIFVERNTRTMSLQDAKEIAAAGDGMVAINDTVFQDANDTIWAVHKDGEISYLVSQIDDNIGDLLGGLSTRSVATASTGVSLEEDFGPGMSLTYYDPRKGEIAFGIATDGNIVYNPEADKLVNVEAAYVISVDEANRAPIETASSKADLLAYMKKLYGHNAEFFAKIKEMISAIPA